MHKRLYALISVIIAVLMLFGYSSLYSYEVKTHAGITEEMVDLFNLTWGNALSKDKKELMIQGSIDEDNVRRFANHFYDPVRRIGLYNHYSAKEWATSSVIQRHDYLTAGGGDEDYSWPRIIQDYAEGNENRAWYGLGHILHLIEDMSVPDHTRNDMHAGHHLPGEITGISHYEDWAVVKDRTSMNGTAELFFARGVQPLLLPDPGAYFDFIANYSNRNFFSANTIVGDMKANYAYPDPKIIEFDAKYGYGRDSENNERFKLVLIEKQKDGSLRFWLNYQKDFSVLEEYFSRLSKQAIVSGTGIINLFIREGNRAREAYQKEQTEKIRQVEEEYQALKNMGTLKRFSYRVLFTFRDYGVRPTTKTVLAVWYNARYSTRVITQAIGSGTSFLASIGKGATRFGAITAREKTGETIDAARNVIDEISAKSTTYIQNITRPISSDQNVLHGTERQMSGTDTFPDRFNSLQREILFLEMEIARMQAAQAAKKARDQAELDARVASLDPPSTFSSAPTPSPTPLLGGTDAGSFSGQFSNSAPEPVPNRAPEPLPNRAPEPVLSPAPTGTSEGAGDLSPSPSESPSPSVSPDPFPSTTPDPSPTATGEPEGSPAPSPSESPTPTPAPTSTPSPPPQPRFAARDIVINEIAWMGTRRENSHDEWIELYNTTDQAIDLTDWKIESPDGLLIQFTGNYQKEIKTAPWGEAHTPVIPAFGYFLLERTDDETTSIPANWFFKGSLPNVNPGGGSSEALARTEGLVLWYEDQEIDRVDAWYAGTTEDGYRTMERISALQDGNVPENWNDNNGVIIRGMSAPGRNIPPAPILGTPGGQNSAALPMAA